ncbi:hypothetical protein KKF91_12490 [Myxococcota bacterium]|nr:hypothetical protein [Myxococcota bacterium]MBU1431351.1 hypothetical protein [Myxococcota bacterium]MBU1898207.1 hypothetical protein [Myxococcota bacterium]
MKPSKILNALMFCLSVLTFGCGGNPEIDGKASEEKGALTLTLKSTSAKRARCFWKAKFKCDGKEIDKIEVSRFDVAPGAQQADTIKAPCENFNYAYQWNCAADAYPEGNTKDPEFSEK